MKTRILFSALVILGSVSLSAQQQGNIEYTPATCILAGEMPIMYVRTADDGVLRSYFRRAGTTEWCSVDGKNLGKASSVMLPKYELGTDLEYYFVVLKGKQVVAKSPQIYHAKATAQCESPIARHASMPVLDCQAPGQNPIADSLNAGYHAASKKPGKPPVQSPEKPERGNH